MKPPAHALHSALLAAALLPAAAAGSPPPAASEAPHGASTPAEAASAETPAAEVPPAEAQPGADDTRASEYAGLLRIGQRKLDAGDHSSALIAYREALRLARGQAELAPALQQLARAHRISGDRVKAVATYEHLLSEHPSWDGTPLVLLELGRALRELGAPRLALARFYAVIQAALRLPEGEAETYRRIVRTAQFEIAETHLAAGDAAEAARFFLRLELLDLAPADRARARFRTAQAQLAAGQRT